MTNSEQEKEYERGRRDMAMDVEKILKNGSYSNTLDIRLKLTALIHPYVRKKENNTGV